MHPAFSVIFFTVASGAGYGLLFMLGLALAFDATLLREGEALLLLGAGAGLTAAGLLSSMLHLGQPLRAWRAFSQWRSSWLSREGIASLLTFAPLLGLGAALHWHADAASVRALALLLAACAALTVACTAKIYTSLRTIRAWHNGYVMPGYLLLGLLSGMAMLQALFSLSAPAWPHAGGIERDTVWVSAHLIVQWVAAASIALLAIAAVACKTAYWGFIDHARAPADAGSATGLGRFGAVRSMEAPHSEENYLTNEMGFVLARKHARRLRAISLALLGLAPLALVPLLVWTPAATTQAAASAVSLLIAACILAGVFVERWLFFAEAKHVVMLYYGTERA